MRLFLNSLSQSESPGPVPVPEVNPVLKLTGGIDTPINSLSWFNPYLASDFPEFREVTKTYFFFYSTDHENDGSRWGEGDNLDLSDFQDGGRMLSLYTSSETPFLQRVGDNVCVYYHPTGEPQETNVNWTPGGGSVDLTDMDRISTWTLVFDTLGLYTAANGNQIGGKDETHTGYTIMQNLPINYEGNDYTHRAQHLAGGNNYATSFHRFSYTNDGINFVRDVIDVQKKFYEPELEVIMLQRGDFFVRGGVTYSFSRYDPSPTYDPDYTDNKKVSLVRYDSDYRNPVYLGEISDFGTSDFSAYIVGNTVHLYFCHPRTPTPTKLYYDTLDITDINNWDFNL